MASNYYELKKSNSSNFLTLDSCFQKFRKNVFALHVNQNEKSEIVKSTSTLLEEVRQYVISAIEKQPNNARKIVEDSFVHINSNLSNINNVYKRDKIVKSLQTYVEPIELSSGFKNALKKDKSSGKSIQSTAQSTFMFISPLKKLAILFSDEEYEQIYMNYNKNHVCCDGADPFTKIMIFFKLIHWLYKSNCFSTILSLVTH